MLKIQWEKLDEGISEPNSYVKEIKDMLDGVLEPIKVGLSEPYYIKGIGSVCKCVNEHFVNGILKIRKLPEMGVLQLLCGNRLSLIQSRFHRVEEQLAEPLFQTRRPVSFQDHPQPNQQSHSKNNGCDQIGGTRPRISRRADPSLRFDDRSFGVRKDFDSQRVQEVRNIEDIGID